MEFFFWVGDWNVITDDVNAKSTMAYQHYKALKCLYNKDKMGVENAIKSGRQEVAMNLKSISLECTNSIYRHLSALVMMQEIEDWCEVYKYP